MNIDSLNEDKLKGMFVLSSQTVVVASGKKTERREGLFPRKGDTTTRRHGLPTKKETKREHARGNLSSAPQEEVDHCNGRMPFQSQLSRQGTMAFLLCFTVRGAVIKKLFPKF